VDSRQSQGVPPGCLRGLTGVGGSFRRVRSGSERDVPLPCGLTAGIAAQPKTKNSARAFAGHPLSIQAQQGLSWNPLTDSNVDPFLTILVQEREPRARAGPRGHESAVNRRDLTRRGDPRVDACAPACVSSSFARPLFIGTTRGLFPSTGTATNTANATANRTARGSQTATTASRPTAARDKARRESAKHARHGRGPGPRPCSHHPVRGPLHPGGRRAQHFEHALSLL
jgi:hypothetical protein